MKKFPIILAAGILWCNISYAKEIILSCEFYTLRNEHIFIIDIPEETRRTYTYIIIPEEKIWKYADEDFAPAVEAKEKWRLWNQIN